MFGASCFYCLVILVVYDKIGIQQNLATLWFGYHGKNIRCILIFCYNFTQVYACNTSYAHQHSDLGP